MIEMMMAIFNLVFRKATERKLIKTGFDATAKAPTPAVIFCIATTYNPR
jgi:hypothetical protein